MQSYLDYKDYYDRKTKAEPMKENDFCFSLQPKADHQDTKNSFRDYRWGGPYIVQKASPNNNYFVRKIKTNKAQILHRIRLENFVPNKPLTDTYRNEELQPDEDTKIPQDDLYTLTWEADFGKSISELADNTSTNVSARPQHSDSESSGETITTRVQAEQINQVVMTSLTSPHTVTR